VDVDARFRVSRGYADGDGGAREELASGLSDVLFMQQIIRKSEPRGIKKSPFSLCDCLCSGILPLERADSARTKL
jgi:hypothetical protein